MANCTRCEDRYDRIREGALQERGDWLCDDCRDALAEGAYERRQQGPAPVTLQERYEADVRQRRELRRHD